MDGKSGVDDRVRVPFPTPRPLLVGASGAVSAAHPLAVTAGQQILALGGNAVDAAIAAQAALCVLMPEACGLGGDLFALIADGGEPVVAVNGSGASPSHQAPEEVTADGGAAVTVPGLVHAWQQLTDGWGRLTLRQTLAPATRLTRAGVPADARLVAAVADQRARLERGGAGGWSVCAVDRPGDPLVQPELAGTLDAIAAGGADAFYRGDLAEAIVAATRRDGGALDLDDLAAHRTVVAEPLRAAWHDATVFVQPPMSQGVLLAMALQWLDTAEGSIDRDVLPHALVEVVGAVFEHRARVGLGRVLLDEPLDVDLVRATRRSGPRAYLHTAGVATADADGQVVSSLLSVFDDFGAATFVPEAGFTLNNRAGGFTGAPNDAAPGKRPVHTLAPALVRHGDSSVAVATPGADGQVQTLLQVLAQVRTPADLPRALAAPRWRSEDGRLLIERGHPAIAGLAARGHLVEELPDGDSRFGAVVCAGHVDGWPVATGDWRRQVWAGVR